MTEVDVFLSDEFISFSSKIKDIHHAKKEKQEAAKQVFDKLKVEIKALDEEALKLKTEWDEYVKAFSESKKSK